MNGTDPESGFYLLTDNTDAFVARLTLILKARHSLDIQYYIIHRDASSQMLGYALLEAADRGVHVRVLVDDIDLSGRDQNLKIINAHPNIEIRIFNPLTMRDYLRGLELLIYLNRAGRRMHNKAFIVDHSYAIIGGRNIGDEYFDARHSLNFVDLDVFANGPVVDEISASFDEYWNSAWARSIDQISGFRVAASHFRKIRRALVDQWRKAVNSDYFAHLSTTTFTRDLLHHDIPFIHAQARLFYDKPEKLATTHPHDLVHIGPVVQPLINEVHSDITLVTPYFVPGKDGLAIITELRARGVSVSVLTNSLAATDVIAVHAGYRKYRQALLALGVQLYELEPSARFFSMRPRWLARKSSRASLHAKYLVVDHARLFIGSSNLDPRSMNLNTETGMMIDSRELAEQALTLFHKSTAPENSYSVELRDPSLASSGLVWTLRENGVRKRYYQEPKTGAWKRLLAFIIGLLPIESLL
jgi:putative cardiolipin synthase